METPPQFCHFANDDRHVFLVIWAIGCPAAVRIRWGNPHGHHQYVFPLPRNTVQRVQHLWRGLPWSDRNASIKCVTHQGKPTHDQRKNHGRHLATPLRKTVCVFGSNWDAVPNFIGYLFFFFWDIGQGHFQYLLFQALYHVNLFHIHYYYLLNTHCWNCNSLGRGLRQNDSCCYAGLSPRQGPQWGLCTWLHCNLWSEYSCPQPLHSGDK